MPFFDIFASPRWSPLRMHTKVVSFLIIFQELSNKKELRLCDQRGLKLPQGGSALIQGLRQSGVFKTFVGKTACVLGNLITQLFFFFFFFRRNGGSSRLKRGKKLGRSSGLQRVLILFQLLIAMFYWRLQPTCRPDVLYIQALLLTPLKCGRPDLWIKNTNIPCTFQ